MPKRTVVRLSPVWVDSGVGRQRILEENRNWHLFKLWLEGKWIQKQLLQIKIGMVYWGCHVRHERTFLATYNTHILGKLAAIVL